MVVCGVDEAGRGPLAGPVTAAAVVLPEEGVPEIPSRDLRDSKCLSPARRGRVAALIRRYAVAWSTGWAWPEEIDELNIHNATLLAMARAVAALPVAPELVLVDGLFTPAIRIPARAIVRGDATVPPIIAAGIIAKTERDRWMVAYSAREPAYGFDRHKGYPTAEHRRLLRSLGPSPIHRRSFTLSDPS
jgi:ribonuclease HII